MTAGYVFLWDLSSLYLVIHPLLLHALMPYPESGVLFVRHMPLFAFASFPRHCCDAASTVFCAGVS